MEAARSDQLHKALLHVLHYLERAPDAWPADAFVGRSATQIWDPAFAHLRMLFTGGYLPPLVLPEALDAELQAALRSAAARGSTAKLASVLACVSRACRAAAHEHAAAEARAARGAHAHAMHDMERALREAADDSLHGVIDDVVAGLAAWCRVPDAATALGGRFADQHAAADKWRVFACNFAEASAMPSRIQTARREHILQQVSQMGALLAGHVVSPPENEDALTELAGQDRGTWRARLVEMLQGAPE
jgi:hypothetical protein